MHGPARIAEAFAGAGGRLFSHPEKRPLHNVCIEFSNSEGKSTTHSVSKNPVMSIDLACIARKVQPSHLLLAINLSDEETYSTISIELNRSNTEEGVNYPAFTRHSAVECLQSIQVKGR